VTAGVGAVVRWRDDGWLVGPARRSYSTVGSRAYGSRSSASPSAAPQTYGSCTGGGLNVAAQISPKRGGWRRTGPTSCSFVEPAGWTITSEDVQAAAGQRRSRGAKPSREPLSQVARLMAERTAQSWTSVPHFLWCGMCLPAAFWLRRSALAPRLKSAGAKLSVTECDRFGCAGVAKHPRINSSWTGTAIQTNADVNISVRWR